MASPEFHYRHSTNPKEVIELLSIISADILDEGSKTTTFIKERARSLGIEIGTKDETTIERYPVWFASHLDLIDNDMNLSPLGKAINNSQSEALVFEVLHFLSYSKWDRNLPADNCFSWTYRRLCETLWNAEKCLIDYHALAASLADQASKEFQELYNISIPKISLSARSIEGIVKWLSMLQPQIIYEDGRHKSFKRRKFCAPELILMAISFLYREKNLECGSSILLNNENITYINNICLLDPLAFEKVLPWAIRQYPNVLEEPHSSGWGRQIRMRQYPDIEILIR